VLGVLSSWLAVWMARIFMRAFYHWIPSAIRRYFHYEYELGHLHGFVLGYLQGARYVFGIVVYLAYHLSRLVVMLSIFTVSIGAFFYFINRKNGHILSIASYISILITCISIYLIFIEYRFIRSVTPILFFPSTKSQERPKEGSDTNIEAKNNSVKGERSNENSNKPDP
jgi:hypothetical protein